MDWLEALILGVIQGLTEWLPVSSSGHLALAQRYLGEVPLVVDILLHFGTMMVLLLFFRKEARSTGRAAMAILRDAARGTGWIKAIYRNRERKLAFLIVLAILPTALFALSFRFLLGGALFSDLALVAAGFAVTGVVLALTAFTGSAASPVMGNGRGQAAGRKKANLPRGVGRLEARDSIAVGVAQGVAFLPGFSRSGLTIGTGLLGGLDSETAGRFSFLIMLPAVLGAMVLELPGLRALAPGDLMLGFAGMLVAMAVGYATLGLLMRILRRGGIHWFAPYCFIACIVTALLVQGGI